MSPKPHPGKPLNQGLLWGGFIIACTIAVYLPSLNNALTNWDDRLYIIDNPMIRFLSWEHIREMFTTFYAGNYHPLTMLSLAVDYRFGKTEPFAYHLTNILLHAANAVLVYFVIRRLTRKTGVAVLAGLLFGLHPLHVESVAWVSERKDVLYAFFFLLSLLCYIRFAADTENKKCYWLSILFFILSLLSKGQAVSLAVTLVLADYFLGRKLLSREVILEKIPFFALALAFGVIAVVAQADVRAMLLEHFPWYERVAFASYGLLMYVVKLILPLGLSAFYPYPVVHTADAIPVLYWACILIWIVPAIVLFKSYRRSKVVFFSILFFLVNIFPVLQLLPVGSAIMADRYAYVPSIGYCLLFGWVLAGTDLLQKYRSGYMIGAAYLVFAGILAVQRTQVWKDSLSLWSDVIAKRPKAALAWYNRGLAKKDAGDIRGALDDFSESIRINPNMAASYNNRAFARKLLKDYRGAIEDYTRTIGLDSAYTLAWYNRGVAKKELRDFSGAISDLDKAISLNPADPYAYFHRAVAKSQSGDPGGAADDYRKTIALEPRFAGAYLNLGSLYLLQNNATAAAEVLEQGVRSAPGNAALFDNLGYAYLELKDYPRSIENFQQCLEISNTNFDAAIGMAMAYLKQGDRAKAKEYYELAARLEPRLKQGEEGIEALETAGYAFSDDKKNTLKELSRLK